MQNKFIISLTSLPNRGMSLMQDLNHFMNQIWVSILKNKL